MAPNFADCATGETPEPKHLSHRARREKTAGWWHAEDVTKTTAASSPSPATQTAASRKASKAKHDAGTPAEVDGSGERIKTLVILGASGDLTGRLLLPGVARLIASGRAPGLALVGAGSDDWSAKQWQDRLDDSFSDALSPGGVSTPQGSRTSNGSRKRAATTSSMSPPRANWANSSRKLRGPWRCTSRCRRQ